MKLDTRIINSKIGRRIFLMFGLCALLPIIALAMSSYLQVSKELETQGYRRLNREAKSHGLAIYERLVLLESELSIVGASLKNGSANFGQPFSIQEAQSLSQRFLLFRIVDENLSSSQGDIGNLHFKDPLTDQEKLHLSEEKTIIRIAARQTGQPDVYMIRQVSAHGAAATYIAGQVDPDYLWGIIGGTSVSAATDIIILDEATNVLYSSAESRRTLSAELRSQMLKKSLGGFNLDVNGEKYLGAYRLIFMQARFLVRGWQVVLLQPESYVFKPMGTFRKTFPVIVAISILLAILLSIFYIRKSMAPLDLLKTGMLGVASQEFHHRINLTSNDEFQELAHHFNQMSGQLAHQFNSLNTRAELDRSILSSFDRHTIIETAISGMQRIFRSDLAAINIFKKRSLKAQMYYILKSSPGVAKDTIVYDEKEFDQLAKYREHLTFSSKNPLPGFLNIYESGGLKHYLVLPVFVEQTLAAVIILATKSPNPFGEMAVVQARQMADQIGVALANANLMKDLNLFGWGTLRAFARAVDAKSPWTAGHSERVARLAVMIAKRMGLDKRTVENVRRAAFLHDIGKIGISSAILDKITELTEEEIGLIRTHPDLGARILEPIEVFTPLIPMIRQHHEKYAGGGYPDGLCKEQIDLGARILSVADVYDAMVCDRPYRKAMTKDRSLTIMADESEKAFDPQVLDVFIEIATASDDLADIYPDTHGQVLMAHNLPV